MPTLLLLRLLQVLHQHDKLLRQAGFAVCADALPVLSMQPIKLTCSGTMLLCIHVLLVLLQYFNFGLLFDKCHTALPFLSIFVLSCPFLPFPSTNFFLWQVTGSAPAWHD